MSDPKTEKLRADFLEAFRDFRSHGLSTGVLVVDMDPTDPNQLMEYLVRLELLDELGSNVHFVSSFGVVEPAVIPGISAPRKLIRSVITYSLPHEAKPATA